MEKIASFSIDHLNLLPGIYVSRKDKIQDAVLTTFDIRVKRPNFEPVINTAEMHTVEHLGATYLRNESKYKDKLVYFGPMGCRTGFYLIIGEDMTSLDAVPVIKEMFEFIASFEGDIPGAAAAECGNYLDHNLDMTKYMARKYIDEVLNDLKPENLNY